MIASWVAPKLRSSSARTPAFNFLIFEYYSHNPIIIKHGKAKINNQSFVPIIIIDPLSLRGAHIKLCLIGQILNPQISKLFFLSHDVHSVAVL